jgi:hypothetical protein
MSTTLDVYPGTMNLPSFAAIIDRSTVELHGFLGSVGIRARPPIHLRIQRCYDDSHVPVGLAAITSPTRRILGVVFSTRESHRRELSRVVTTLPGLPRRRTGGRRQRQRRCERELMPGSPRAWFDSCRSATRIASEPLMAAAIPESLCRPLSPRHVDSAASGRENRPDNSGEVGTTMNCAQVLNRGAGSPSDTLPQRSSFMCRRPG